MTVTAPVTETVGETATTLSTLQPRGVNHLAIATCDMKAQLTYFSEVLGCPTKALYWMHGVENTFHGFVELSGDCYLAFVQHPDNRSDIQWGISHAGSAGSPVMRGAMQHLAFHVDTLAELLEMRDRIRGNGIQVLGPIDHGFVKSIYFGGLEGMSLEVACGADIDAESWIDPEVTELCGISTDELADLKRPRPFERSGEAVAQPAYHPDSPSMHYSPRGRDAIMGMPDDEVWAKLSETTPPIQSD